jgi:hypothetical protein
VYVVIAVVVTLSTAGTLFLSWISYRFCNCKCRNTLFNWNDQRVAQPIVRTVEKPSVAKPSCPVPSIQTHCRVVESRTYQSIPNQIYNLPVVGDKFVDVPIPNQIYNLPVVDDKFVDVPYTKIKVPRSNTDSTWNQVDENDDAQTIPYQNMQSDTFLSLFDELKRPIVD